MSQPPLPAGCSTVQTTALLLGVSEQFLFKKLRELRWLHTGTYKNDPTHNTPSRHVKLAGFVSTHTRGFSAPYNKSVAIVYRVPIITERGLNELRKIMNVNNDNIPKPTPLTMENAQKAQHEIKTTTANEEREKCLNQFREWGLAS